MTVEGWVPGALVLGAAARASEGAYPSARARAREADAAPARSMGGDAAGAMQGGMCKAWLAPGKIQCAAWLAWL
jgi:hypothetical protein